MKYVWAIVIVLSVMLLLYIVYKSNEHFMNPSPIQILGCANAHSETGLNYPWLDHIHGGLKKIIYEAPLNSGIWQNYDDMLWEQHCKYIDHHPSNLVAAHVARFITPATKDVNLLFIFKDGTMMPPIKEFYDLEAKWFSTYMYS